MDVSGFWSLKNSGEYGKIGEKHFSFGSDLLDKKNENKNKIKTKPNQNKQTNKQKYERKQNTGENPKRKKKLAKGFLIVSPPTSMGSTDWAWS